MAQTATFLTIGLWHGAEFKYIAYGLYNGGIIILGLLLDPYLKAAVEKLHINVKSTWWKLFQIIRTFMLIVIGRMFPKAASFTVALSMYVSILKGSDVSYAEQIVTLGLDPVDFLIIAIGCTVWFIISFLQEKGVQIRESLGEKPLVLRWAFLFAGLLVILIFGIYGPGYDASAFIYRGF